MDETVDRFNASISFDKRLYAQDIEGSMAHCKMLAKQDVIGEEEASIIMKALSEIKLELDRGALEFDERAEDIHSYVEQLLTDRVGDIGKKIHTGRSRNDQVSTDVRLYVREGINEVCVSIKKMQGTLVRIAEEHLEVILPGYTHLQRAQPVLLAHHLLAYYEMLKRDLERFRESLKRVNVLPLGSAALAGSTFVLDREMAAQELGFDTISQNSMDAVSDRDFVLEFLFNTSLLMMHLSRLSEELILWSTQEFNFVRLPDSLCTGSSIMPQKKNPDLPELTRGKTGRVYGHLMSLLTTMKGLPLTYNKDMQEDKEALFDTKDTVIHCMLVMDRLLEEITFQRDMMRQAAEEGYLVATDLADYLVGKGVAFRQAHELVGRMVLFAMDKGKELKDLSLKEMRQVAPEIDSDVYGWLDPESCIRRRNIKGGTGHDMVKERIAKAKEELGV
jgi:argininosuccinate lyase